VGARVGGGTVGTRRAAPVGVVMVWRCGAAERAASDAADGAASAATAVAASAANRSKVNRTILPLIATYLLRGRGGSTNRGPAER
jgi:hypothetical protein